MLRSLFTASRVQKTTKFTKNVSNSFYSSYKLQRMFSAVIDADVETQVMEVTRNFLENVKNGEITKLDRTSSFEELGLDSLDAIDLIVELEEAFGLDLENDDAENRIKTVADAAEVFTEYKARGSNPTE